MANDLLLLQSRHVLARLRPDMYFKMPKCQNVGDSEVGDTKLATRKDTKIGEIVDYRRRGSAVGTPPLSYSSVARFLPSDLQREGRVLRWLFYPSKFSILLSSLPSRGTTTTEGRNFGADHLEGPSAAETQFYNIYIRLAFTSGLALRIKEQPTLQNPNCRKQTTIRWLLRAASTRRLRIVTENMFEFTG
jgi:hypothetical protein